jgi:hypothetical protein
MESVEISLLEDPNEDEIMLIERISEIAKKRRKRVTIGAFFVSASLLFMQLSILILLGVIAVSAVMAILFIGLAPITMALGLYLLLHNPPIILEE